MRQTGGNRGCPGNIWRLTLRYVTTPAHPDEDLEDAATAKAALASIAAGEPLIPRETVKAEAGLEP
jgi:hypothetical protein